jgi:hypothetical protein
MPVINMLPHGGSESETVLWTNPSPTSSFAAQSVTLSDSLLNYKYLKITYRSANTNVVNYYTLYPIVDDNGEIIYAGGNGNPRMIISYIISSGTARQRRFSIEDSAATTIYFTTCQNIGSSSTTVNGAMIPITISGIK